VSKYSLEILLIWLTGYNLIVSTIPLHVFKTLLLQCHSLRLNTLIDSKKKKKTSAARRADTPLTVFHDYTTNTDIQGFPATPAELANMTGVELNPVLRALNLPVNGTIGTKRQQLRFYIGLTDMPQ
jgi:hypothetical protein